MIPISCKARIHIYLLISLLLAFGTSCKTTEDVYRYNLTQKMRDQNGAATEFPHDSYISTNGHIFEYETMTRIYSENKDGGTQKSYRLPDDTLGLYLLKPESDKYFKISQQGNQIKFVESGSLQQKKFGITFGFNPAKQKEFFDPNSSRDTTVDGIKLKIYEKQRVDSSTNDVWLLRYYFFKNPPISSLLTHMTAISFDKGEELFRFEAFSKNTSMFIFSVQDIEKLPDAEANRFRKLAHEAQKLK